MRIQGYKGVERLGDWLRQPDIISKPYSTDGCRSLIALTNCLAYVTSYFIQLSQACMHPDWGERLIGLQGVSANGRNLLAEPGNMGIVDLVDS